jgi:hypothetical protein
MTDVEEIEREYFVDEAGDPTIFSSKKGKVLIGTEGCSNYFMMGFAHIADVRALTEDIENLRRELLADPYFAEVPSMQPRARKTALAFHAKDDLPEVRHKVYKLIMAHDVRFFAVIRDKKATLAWAEQQREQDSRFRYRPNDLYDFLVRRLFQDHLHQANRTRIRFARRGKSDRTHALQQALEAARDRFCNRWDRKPTGRVIVDMAYSHECAGLQTVDYMLWALQRLYERGEGRFWNAVWPAARLVIDIDDRRNKEYGEYYSQQNPLTADRLKDRHGI